jgi:PKD repeat protein
MAFGPDGATQSLYYTNYRTGGQLRKIRYTGSVNRPPTSAVSATPTAGRAPLSVLFDGSASSDPDGTLVSYRWDFGDGSAPLTASGPTISHTYTRTGTFRATLTVRDPGGLSGSASVTVHPGDIAPTVKITAPTATQLFTAAVPTP